jgi:anti-anti-sigma factor
MESSKIGVSKVGPRTVLVPREALTYQNCAALEAAFDSCFTHQMAEVILDMNEVPLLDSEALELLLRMHDELKTRGSVLKMIRLNDIVKDVLVATRLITVFSVYQNISEAIRSGS